MDDQQRQATTDGDTNYSLTIEQTADRYVAAGHPRTLRTLQRYCGSGHLDCRKVSTALGDKYFVAPYSVARHIAQVEEMSAFTQRATSRDESRLVATPDQQNSPDFDGRQIATEPDLSRRVATTTATEIPSDILRHTGPTGDDTSRPVATTIAVPQSRADTSVAANNDLQIYDHPYVKRLEAQVEKLEEKYENQVRRTEEIQVRSHERLIELQRMTTVGQSQTLAEYLLKAKEWAFGGESKQDSTDRVPNAVVSSSAPVQDSAAN